MTCHPSEWKKTTYTQIVETADKFNIPASHALKMRHRYIDEKIAELTAKINADAAHLDNESEVLERRIYLDSMVAGYKEINKLEKSRPRKPTEGKITDAMIQQAREYPIELVVEFNRGLALAFCHNDKTPSLTWNRKNNTSRCFPCDKSFNPIDVLMQRDGKSFIEAVKELSQ